MTNKKPKIEESGAEEPPVVEPSAEPSGDLSSPASSASDVFIGADGRKYRRRHEQRGSGWFDWSEPAE